MADVKKERPKVLDIDYIASQPVEKKEDTTGVDNFKKWFKEMKK